MKRNGSVYALTGLILLVAGMIGQYISITMLFIRYYGSDETLLAPSYPLYFWAALSISAIVSGFVLTYLSIYKRQFIARWHFISIIAYALIAAVLMWPVGALLALGLMFLILPTRRRGKRQA